MYGQVCVVHVCMQCVCVCVVHGKYEQVREQSRVAVLKYFPRYEAESLTDKELDHLNQVNRPASFQPSAYLSFIPQNLDHREAYMSPQVPPTLTLVI